MKNKTPILIVILSIGLVAIILSIAPKDNAQKPLATKGFPAPDIEVYDIVGGKKLSSADLRGKVLFINFWATWCQPCREEAPSIEALYKELSANDKFAMITVLYRDDARNALELMKTAGFTFPVYIDAEGISAKQYGVTGVPETYVVDKKGIIRERVIGPASWNSPDMKNPVLSLTAE